MPTPSKPYFTVIIPARNEENYIENAIKSVKAQDYTSEAELIIVDNGSVDATASIATKLGAKVVSEKRVGLPRAREAGRLAAHGEILVYFDADTMIPKNYLSTIASTFHNNPGTVGVSNPFTFYDGTATHRFVINLFFKVVYPLQNFLLHLLGKSHQLLGGNFAVRSNILEKLGGFNTKITFAGEDLAISKTLAGYGDITILPHLCSQTSARRFRSNGTIRTCGVYLKNFFSVLLINKDSDGTIIRRFLKILLLAIVFFLLFRHLHLLRLFTKDPDQTMLYVSIIVGAFAAYGTFNPKSSLFGTAVSKFDTHEKIVALTFDDGPREKHTERILKILRAENITATFFLVGKNAATHPELVNAIVNDDHVIGNHTYSHRWLFPFMSSARIGTDVDKTQRIIQNIIGMGRTHKIFRPPHGWRTPWMMSELTKNGYKVITWTVSLDYIPGVTAGAIIKHYKKHTKPGSILLFHDTIWEKPEADRDNLTTALPEIIRHLKHEGYKFVSITDML